jgi:hypothetical protein
MNIQNLTQNFNVMQIVIVKKSDLNNCWSPYQYTNNCAQCDKVLTCKIKSIFHKKGIVNYAQEKIQSLNAEFKERTETIINNSEKALLTLKNK